jgi:hypothetical protein
LIAHLLLPLRHGLYGSRRNRTASQVSGAKIIRQHWSALANSMFSSHDLAGKNDSSPVLIRPDDVEIQDQLGTEYSGHRALLSL